MRELPGEHSERPKRRGIRPVKIFDRERYRDSGCDLLDQGQQSLDDLITDVRDGSRDRRRRPIRFHVDETSNVAYALVCRLGADGERVQERPERAAALELVGGALEHLKATALSFGERFGQQAALADPRLPLDPGKPTSARSAQREQLGELPELGCPTEQGSVDGLAQTDLLTCAVA
jgi:hypothetical protein